MQEQRDINLVHFHDGKWWFWDESWSQRIGPYLTKESAYCGLATYTDWLKRNVQKEKN